MLAWSAMSLQLLSLMRRLSVSSILESFVASPHAVTSSQADDKRRAHLLTGVCVVAMATATNIALFYFVSVVALMVGCGRRWSQVGGGHRHHHHNTTSLVVRAGTS